MERPSPRVVATAALLVGAAVAFFFGDYAVAALVGGAGLALAPDPSK